MCWRKGYEIFLTRKGKPMATNLTTLNAEQLAERAAACLGWTPETTLAAYGSKPFWRTYRTDYMLANMPGHPVADWDCPTWSPATNDAQAAELMRAAVEKVGAAKFADELFAILPIVDGWTLEDTFRFLATADARARTIAAIACLESTDPKPENERG